MSRLSWWVDKSIVYVWDTVTEVVHLFYTSFRVTSILVYVTLKSQGPGSRTPQTYPSLL